MECWHPIASQTAHKTSNNPQHIQRKCEKWKFTFKEHGLKRTKQQRCYNSHPLKSQGIKNINCLIQISHAVPYWARFQAVLRTSSSKTLRVSDGAKLLIDLIETLLLSAKYQHPWLRHINTSWDVLGTSGNPNAQSQHLLIHCNNTNWDPRILSKSQDSLHFHLWFYITHTMQDLWEMSMVPNVAPQHLWYFDNHSSRGPSRLSNSLRFLHCHLRYQSRNTKKALWEKSSVLSVSL